MKFINGWWLPDQEQHLCLHLADHGEYQQENRRWALAGLEPGGVAIDVGAHVGLWLRDLCLHFDHVIAVEPVPSHQQCLRQNVTADNYTVWTCMLGDTASEAGLKLDPENTGHTHRQGPGLHRVIPLDQVWDSTPVRFIKIDVEGDEVNVIRGAESVIRTHRPRMCIEQKPHELSEAEGRYAARDLLKAWGYRPLRHRGDDWVLEHAG